jgi:hypothetical protein
MEEVIRWIVGLLMVSLLLGHYATRAFILVLEQRIGIVDPSPPSDEVSTKPGQLQSWLKIPEWLRRTMVGLVERTFFTVVIGAGLGGAAVAMILWTGLKGTLYWTAYEESHPANILVALLGNVVSLLFAVVGGCLCNGELWGWCAEQLGR